jgi:DNA polymerase III alpha subunit (gram-positive type)
MKYRFFFDCETTGLKSRQHSIIQLAGIIVDEGYNEIAQFNEFCQPHRYDNIDDIAVSVHGISPEKMKTFQTQKEFLEKLLTLTKHFLIFRQQLLLIRK